MRMLAIECATEACSVALFDDGALIASDHRILGRGHAEHLVPMIAALPDRGKADRILVSLGPGSFTGVRIGIATARALGYAWGAPVAGYPTLALMSAIARADHDAGAVDVCMTGGHGEWFVQSFDYRGLPIQPLASLAPDDAAAAATADFVIGTQADALAALRGSGQPCTAHPDARFAVHLPEQLCSASVAPIYGRAPDAKLPGTVPQ